MTVWENNPAYKSARSHPSLQRAMEVNPRKAVRITSGGTD